MIDEPPLDAPDEEWLVWADAMQEIGDPRGELLALRHPAAYVLEHADALFGPRLGAHVRAGDAVITAWQRHLPLDIELRVADRKHGPQLVVDLSAAACAPTLRGLTIAGVGTVELDLTLGWFRETALARTIKSLALVDDDARARTHLVSPAEDPPPNAVRFGPLHEVFHACTELETFKMVLADPGQLQFYGIRAPALRSFTLHALCWVNGLADMLANPRWPQLRAFELRTCETYLDNDDIFPRGWALELAPLFDALRELPLERLAITSWLVHDVLDLLEGPLPPTLTELDLSDSGFDEHAAARLASNPLLGRLRRLVLERVRLASPALLRGKGTQVIHSCSPTAPTYYHIIVP